jgi:hypothetical protein
MKFVGNFITQDLDDQEWLIVDAYAFFDSKDVLHHVYKKTKTDGASIPRVLWILVGHPRSTDIAQAAGLHDVHYQRGGHSRKRCDEILIEGMEVLGAGWWKRKTVYYGLRAGGWVAWNKYRKKD